MEHLIIVVVIQGNTGRETVHLRELRLEEKARIQVFLSYIIILQSIESVLLMDAAVKDEGNIGVVLTIQNKCILGKSLIALGVDTYAIEWHSRNRMTFHLSATPILTDHPDASLKDIIRREISPSELTVILSYVGIIYKTVVVVVLIFIFVLVVEV